MTQNTVKSHFFAGLSAIGVVTSVALGSPTLAATANFDSFSEGFSGTSITDDGIKFFDLDQRLSPELVPYKFYIESTEENLGSLFSPPNYLTAGGFAEGSDFAFGRFGSARISTGKVERSASLDIFSQLFSPSKNTLTLEALLNGKPVASSSAALADFDISGTSSLLQKTLAVSGVEFDELRLVASGPDDDGVAFIGVDNVRVGVPEPNAASGVLAVGAISALSLLKRKRKSVI